MSFQIFLHGKILGTEEFLRSSANDLDGRAYWLSLLSEVIPRALLAELGLSPMLLGASGGDQFLLVIPAEVRARAEEFCSGIASDAAARSGAAVRLIWAITENLGSWSDIRRRLDDELERRAGTPAALAGAQAFEPGLAARVEDFARLANELRSAESIGWSPDEPSQVKAGSGVHTWTLSSIALARHAAMNDQDTAPAGLKTLASRARGRRTWGVLRGGVDGFSARLRKTLTIEEHLAMSEMYKRFFAGEAGVLCAMPDYWRKVTILQATPGAFAVYGAWDALIGFARELQRVFQVFVEANLRDQAGAEGKTISMAVALARSNDQALAEVYAEAGDWLNTAKTTGRDSIYLLHRVLEWKQLSDAAETRQVLTRLIRDFRCSPDLLNELASYYRESDTRQGLPSRTRNDRVDRPWRFHRRINMVLGASRNKDFQRLRSELISDFTGKKAAQVRLRPQGRVALEWTRLDGRLVAKRYTSMAENEQQQSNQTAEKRPNNERAGGAERSGGGDRGERRGPTGGGGGPRREGQGGGGGPRGDRPGGDRGSDRDRGDRGGGDRGRERRFDGPPEIDLEKLIQDSLYLDNQAHAVVARMRDMDSGTKSQLRRFYNAVRRACSAAESDKQHQFVMLRARLAYTIARHQLRSLDILEKLLLQVTRKNDAKGYERFRDLFEAIVAYNE